MAELLLDSKIRFWVFLPIMAITFLVGIIKHYLFIFMSNDKTAEKQQIFDSQALLRSRLLRENGKFLPKEVHFQLLIEIFLLLLCLVFINVMFRIEIQSFLMRKSYFVNQETGFFIKEKRTPTVKMPLNGNTKSIIKKKYSNFYILKF